MLIAKGLIVVFVFVFVFVFVCKGKGESARHNNAGYQLALKVNPPQYTTT